MALVSFGEEILDFEGALLLNPFVLSLSKDAHKSYSEIKVLIFSMVRQVRFHRDSRNRPELILGDISDIDLRGCNLDDSRAGGLGPDHPGLLEMVDLRSSQTQQLAIDVTVVLPQRRRRPPHLTGGSRHLPRYPRILLWPNLRVVHGHKCASDFEMSVRSQ